MDAIWLGPADVVTYQASKKALQEIDTSSYSESERAHVNAMIRDCEYVIRWLQTGHNPSPQRGVERRAGHQREKLVDPLIMQSYVQRGAVGSPTTISDSDRQLLEDALSVLSPRERECYVLAHGQCFSHAEIANMLGIDRGNVAKFIQRAQTKLSRQYFQTSLHLVV